MPESVYRRGSSGPTTGATDRSAASLSSMAMAGGYSRVMVQRADGADGTGGLRNLPAVDRLADEVDAPRPLSVAAARAVLAARRAELLAGAEGEADLPARARAWAAALSQPGLRRVL